MDLQARIYVLGGNTLTSPPYCTDSCVRFDETTGSWESIPSMSICRSNYGIASDHLGRIYAIGGFTDTSPPFTSQCERFVNTPTQASPDGHWEPIAPLPRATGYIRSVATPDGHTIIAFGGQSTTGASNAVYRYDVDSDTWYSEVSAIYAHYTPGMAITASGVIYATGEAGSVVRLQRRDPSNGQWTDLGTTPLTVNQIGACVADQFDNIYFCGGYGNNGATASTWRYESRSGTWFQDTSLPSRTANMASVISRSSKLYLIGGDPGTGSIRLTTVLYAQLSSQPNCSPVWTTGAPPPSHHRPRRVRCRRGLALPHLGNRWPAELVTGFDGVREQHRGIPRCQRPGAPVDA